MGQGSADAPPGAADAPPGAADAHPGTADAPPGSADAPPGSADAPPGAAEDFDLEVTNYSTVTNFMPTNHGTYLVANALGHETEALAAANAASTFPVGSVVKSSSGSTELMVKRRAGFHSDWGDWEFITVTLTNGKATQLTRDEDGTKCFNCHSSHAPADYICVPPPNP